MKNSTVSANVNATTTTTTSSKSDVKLTQLIIGYFERKFNSIKNRSFSLKALKKSVHIKKSPKRKGYGKLVTDEEKRFESLIDLFEFNTIAITIE